MTQRSLFWDGIVLGDSGPYASVNLHDQMLRSITGCTGNKGVLLNWLNGLEVTGGASPVNVASGAALVYGTFFESDSAVSVLVNAPSAGYSRYDVIVVRRSVADQTARIGKVTGNQATDSPVIPTLTQDALGIYEIPLATLLIADTGVITITDSREYAIYSTTWPPNLVTGDMIVNGAINADKLTNHNRWKLKGAGAIVPDATNPCTGTAGANYDFWAFATGVTNEGWVYFMFPTGVVPGTLAFYLWTVPDVAAAGDVKWDWLGYYGTGTSDGVTLMSTTGSILIAQGGRAIANSYRDAFFTITNEAIFAGDIIALQVKRDGGAGADTYGSSARLLGVEMYWTGDT